MTPCARHCFELARRRLVRIVPPRKIDSAPRCRASAPRAARAAGRRSRRRAARPRAGGRRFVEVVVQRLEGLDLGHRGGGGYSTRAGVRLRVLYAGASSASSCGRCAWTHTTAADDDQPSGDLRPGRATDFGSPTRAAPRAPARASRRPPRARRAGAARRRPCNRTERASPRSRCKPRNRGCVRSPRM